MDDLIIEIQEKANLSRDKVLEVVTIVTEFMQERLPADVIETVSEYLSDPAGATVTVVTSGTDMAKEVSRSAVDMTSQAANKAVGTAAAAFSKTTDAVSGVMNSDDDES